MGDSYVDSGQHLITRGWGGSERPVKMHWDFLLLLRRQDGSSNARFFFRVFFTVVTCPRVPFGQKILAGNLHSLGFVRQNFTGD